MIASWQATQSILEAFPHILQSDIYDGLRVIKDVGRMIAGRVCGSTADKLSQYFAIINYFRETGEREFSSLEIGTLFGGSCLIKLMAMKSFGIRGKIVCIDPMSGYYEDTLDPISGIPVSKELFWANIRKFGFSADDVTLILKKSSDPSALSSLADHRFATIFIDGDHRLEAISHDWNHYARLISDKGVVLIDDFADPAWPDVTMFVDSRLANVSEYGWSRCGLLGSTIIFRKQNTKRFSDSSPSGEKEAFKLPPDVIFSIDPITLKLKLADIYAQQGKIEQAKDMYMTIDNRNNPFAEEHKFIASLGLARLQIKNNPDEVLLFNRKLNVQSIPSLVRTIKTIKEYGEILINLEEYEAAKSLYTDSILLMPLSNRDKFLLLQKLGQIEKYQGNIQKATVYIKASLTLPAISAREIGLAVNTLSSFYLKLNLHGKAEDCLQKYMKEDIAFSKSIRGSMFLTLGYIMLQRKEYKAAVNYYKLAINLLNTQNTPRAHALLGLGYSLHALRAHTEACKYFKEALSIKNVSGFDKKKASIALSQCCRNTGSVDQTDEVLIDLRK